MKKHAMVWLAFGVAVGCTTAGEHTGNKPQQDRIGPSDNPNNLIPGASALLTDNIVASDVGQAFGVDDAHVPYPDTYWPFTGEGTNATWNGGVGPLEKFMGVVDPTHAPDAKNWEHANHGPAVPNVASWWGHCPGWTGAAMSNAPILHAVFASSDGAGGLKACNSGDAGCTRFEIGDVNALEAESWVDGANSFIGARCDVSPADIQRDQYGRIVRSGNGCQGLNAGALLIVLGNRMKQQHLAMAIDAQSTFNTDQIWNQPAYRYHVYRYDTLMLTEAANLVAHAARTGDMTTYPWDTSAQGFVFVDIGIQWVSEFGPNTTVVSGLSSTREMRFVAVIELDSANTDPNAHIIGGEFIDDSTVGANRLTVPPFVWISTDSGSDVADPANAPADGNGHNPWIKPSLVKQLIAMGTTGTADVGPASADAGPPANGDDASPPNDAAPPNPTADAAPPNTADAAPPNAADAGASDPCTGLSDGSYCGGDQIMGDSMWLYTCANGTLTGNQACPTACIPSDAGSGDTCM